jgi:hypothetical protein
MFFLMNGEDLHCKSKLGALGSAPSALHANNKVLYQL